MNTYRQPFIDAMARRIVEERKVMTRRPLSISRVTIDGPHCRIPWRKDGAKWSDFDFGSAWVDPGPSPAGNHGPYLHVPMPKPFGSTHRVYPRVQPGDRIMGTEVHMIESTFGMDFDYKLADLADRPVRIQREDFPDEIGYEWQEIPRYRATEPDADLCIEDDEAEDGYRKAKWAPPMFMPAWASRLPLLVKEVRIERLQDITPQDCIREGIAVEGDPTKPGWGWTAGAGFPSFHGPIAAFKHLIESINPGAWERNDWMLVYLFEYLKHEAGRVILPASPTPQQTDGTED